MRSANIFLIGLATKFEVSGFTLCELTDGFKKNSVPGPWSRLFGSIVLVFLLHPFQIRGRGYLKISIGPWPRHFGGIFSFTRRNSVYEIRSFYIHVSSPVPKILRRCHAMAGCARVYAQTNAWISVIFIRSHLLMHASIVDWSELNAFVSNFYMFLNYRYSATVIVCFLHKMVHIFDFSAPFVPGCTALRKKETVKINMVYTLERAAVTICLSEMRYL